MTKSEKSPRPPFVKGGVGNAPFWKGSRAQRGEICPADCANLLPLGLEELSNTKVHLPRLIAMWWAEGKS